MKFCLTSKSLRLQAEAEALRASKPSKKKKKTCRKLVFYKDKILFSAMTWIGTEQNLMNI